jgi:hypothetical protein
VTANLNYLVVEISVATIFLDAKDYAKSGGKQQYEF